jgi:hypothetical protein
MAKLIVQGNQTIDGTTYADGDVFDARTISLAEQQQLRRAGVLADAFEYALARSRALALRLKKPGRHLDLVNQVHVAQEHLASSREQWLAIDPSARALIEKYEALLAE